MISKHFYLMGHLDRSRNVHDYEKLKKFQPMRMDKVHKGQGITAANSKHAVMAAYVKIIRENKRATLEAMKKTNFFRLLQKEVGLVKTVQGKEKMLSLETIRRIMKDRDRQKYPFCPGERQ